MVDKSEREKRIEAQRAEFVELLKASEFDYTPLERGEIRKAIVLQRDPRGDVIVDLGAKQDGLVPAQDLERLDPEQRDSIKVGDEVYVYVINPRDMEGNLIVSIAQGLQQKDWDEARRLLNTDEVVEVLVTGYNRGGVLVRWRQLEGFIPTSHLLTMGLERREAHGKQILGCKVIEVDQARRRLIFSEREAQKEWRQQQKAKLLSELMEGDVVKGVVTGLRDFGAFVNLGGADGLIHVSELAWHRVDHPKDILHVGDEIEVYVLSLDRDTNRIALSRKRLLPDPWSDAMNRYHEGQQVEGNVTNVVDFGAFIALDDGLEGLLHLTEMGDGALKEPYSYIKKGDRLQLRISRLEPDKRRVGFTQRWGVPTPVLDENGNPIEGTSAAPTALEDAPASAVELAATDIPDTTDTTDSGETYPNSTAANAELASPQTSEAPDQAA